MKIILSKTIQLPLEIVTQTIALLAKRRSGKSYTMRKIIEQLFKAKQQVVIVDPKGDQWGIRSSADGKRPGYPVVILGGEHGDAPLEPNSGEIVANLVVKERVSVLLDLSFFRKHEVATFMTGFLENLYRLKAREEYRTPMMLAVDEADAVAPQKPQKGEERMLGAIEDIVRRGGQRGIGCMLVTQRSAVLNKNVLTQAQMLVVLRTIAPQDLAAMKAWVDVHGTIEEGKTLMASLPSLPVGDAWFWSPGWPTDKGIFERAHVLPIETFDSGATPKVGQKVVVPKNLADVDLDALKVQMAATIEKAKNENPKALQGEVARLKRELASHICPAQKGVDQKDFERQVRSALEPHLVAFGTVENGYKMKLKEWKEWALNIQEAFKRFPFPSDKLPATYAPERAKVPKFDTVKVGGQTHTFKPSLTPRILSPSKEVPADGSFSPSAPQLKIINALAWLESANIQPATKSQTAFIAEVKPNTGSYANNLGALRSAGVIEYPKAGFVGLTRFGRSFVNLTDQPPLSDEELQRQIKARVSAPQWKILDVLIRTYSEPLSKDELAERVGILPGTGSFANNLGALRTLGLIDYPSAGMVVGLPTLFLR